MNPERRKLYPKDWPKLANACREQANFQCQHCHIPQGSEKVSRRTGQLYKVQLHAAHANHDIDNPAPQLLCLCPSCHGKYDYEHLKRTDPLKSEQLKHKLLLASRR